MKKHSFYNPKILNTCSKENQNSKQQGQLLFVFVHLSSLLLCKATLNIDSARNFDPYRTRKLPNWAGQEFGYEQFSVLRADFTEIQYDSRE